MNMMNRHAGSFEEPLERAGRTCIEPDPCVVVPMRFMFILVPGFSQLCLSSLIDPLRIANAVSGRDLFTWKLVSEDGQPVVCASGIRVCVDSALGEQSDLLNGGHRVDVAVVCAGDWVERYEIGRIVSFLRVCARRGLTLCGLGTGTWVLAAAGLLANARCTIHWSKLAALSETFSRLNAADVLFVEQGNVTTCAGGLAAFDLALNLIERHADSELAQTVCGFVSAVRWREGENCQSVPLGLRLSGASLKLEQVIRLMEQNLEEPLSLYEIAQQVGSSRRQVERLFRRHFRTTPHHYYLTLRLERARQLIESTDMRLTNVAMACGFASASHFTKCIREHFGRIPSKLRDNVRETRLATLSTSGRTIPLRSEDWSPPASAFTSLPS